MFLDQAGGTRELQHIGVGKGKAVSLSRRYILGTHRLPGGHLVGENHALQLGAEAPAQRGWTYANLALMRARQVNGVVVGTPAKLGPLLFASAQRGRLGGEPWHGSWHNLGTPEQLAALNAVL